MRMSAQYVGKAIGLSTSTVYEIWEKMGLVYRDRIFGWQLTEEGQKIGGRLSKSNYQPVPVFDLDMIVEKMNEFEDNRRDPES